jgi:transcriptional regulator GlxA family with amidase domain
MSETEQYTDIFREVQSFMEQNYSNSNVAISDFVAARGISQRQVVLALSYHAKSWARLLLDVRMQKARELLSYSGESIPVIADKCGYSNVFTFERTFRAEEEKGPEEFRTWMQKERQEAEAPNGSPSS